MDMTPGMIELYIDELVLEGVDPSARDAIGDAVQARLLQLLGERPPAVAGDARVTQVTAESISVSVQAHPQSLGSAIAASVHEGLTR